MLKLFLLIAAISISYQKRGPLWKIENKSDLDDILFKNISSHAIKYMMLAANHSIQAIEKLGLLSDALEARMKETEELIDEENRAQEEMAKQCLAEKMVQQSCFMCYQEKCLEILQNCESEKDDLTAGAYKTMGKHEPFNRKKSFDIGAMVLSVTETVTSTDKQKTTILELEKFVEEDPVITYFNNLYKELMQEETEWIKQGITEDDVDYRNDVNFDPRDIFDYDYQYEVYEESFESADLEFEKLDKLWAKIEGEVENIKKQPFDDIHTEPTNTAQKPGNRTKRAVSDTKTLHRTIVSESIVSKEPVTNFGPSFCQDILKSVTEWNFCERFFVDDSQCKESCASNDEKSFCTDVKDREIKLQIVLEDFQNYQEEYRKQADLVIRQHCWVKIFTSTMKLKLHERDDRKILIDSIEIDPSRYDKTKPWLFNDVQVNLSLKQSGGDPKYYIKHQKLRIFEPVNLLNTFSVNAIQPFANALINQLNAKYIEIHPITEL